MAPHSTFSADNRRSSPLYGTPVPLPDYVASRAHATSQELEDESPPVLRDVVPKSELPLSPLEQLELIPTWKRGVVLIGAFAVALAVLALTLHGLASAVTWLFQ